MKGDLVLHGEEDGAAAYFPRACLHPSATPRSPWPRESSCHLLTPGSPATRQYSSAALRKRPPRCSPVRNRAHAPCPLLSLLQTPRCVTTISVNIFSASTETPDARQSYLFFLRTNTNLEIIFNTYSSDTFSSRFSLPRFVFSAFKSHQLRELYSYCGVPSLRDRDFSHRKGMLFGSPFVFAVCF